jgi:hypothetical protein
MRDLSIEIVHAASRPDPGGRRPMTGFDRANRILAIRGTWLFRDELDGSRLKESLSDVLSLWPHLAGRATGQGAVLLNDAGVPFATGRRSDLTVDAVRARPETAGELSLRMRVGRAYRGGEAPLSVLLTRLRDGCALGVRVSHAWLDGHAFYGMVRTWSRIHGGRPFDPPDLDQTRVPPPTGRSKTEAIRAATNAGWRRPDWLGLITTVPALVLGMLHERAEPIRFSPEALDRIRREARREAGRDDLTTNDALSAHLTRLCLALHRLPPGTSCAQATVIDLRGRLPSLPAAFAGNAAFVVPADPFPAGATLGEIASRTRDAMARALDGSPPALAQDLALTQDLMRHGVVMLPYDVAAVHRRRPTVVYVNSFARLPIYNVDFGAPDRPIAPAFVVPHDLPDPVLVWPAPPSTGGVEAYLTGRQAHALRRLDPGDPWWAEATRFERG